MKQDINFPVQFFLTAPAPCPYLAGQRERKVFTHLTGRNAIALNNALTNGGFRRSQTIAYRPACETCRACVSVRVCVQDFTPSRTMRKIGRANQDITSRMLHVKPSFEQFTLFRTYLDHRHPDGGMAGMSLVDYATMVEDSHVETRLIEYRKNTGVAGRLGALVAVALTDLLDDGLSMVYSFFDPDEERRSLGTFMILDHIARAKSLGLAYVYLGYWIKGSRKMAYKARFMPQERLGMEGWVRVEGQ